MKTKSNLNLLLTLIFSVNFLSSFGSFKDEVQKLFRPDLLPQFCGGIVRQVSSYDTTGGNDDGFSGKYSYLRKEGNTLVIADLAGPGVIQRIWTPTPAGDTIQFYFDGEPFPRIELKFSDLFSGNTYPFLRPVVGNEVGGFYCYLPIPYNKSCKIVYKGKRMQFIQIQYREQIKAPIETFPKVFSEAEKKSLDSVISAWKKSGQNILESIPAYNNQIKTKTVNLRLKQGQTESFFNLNSGGRVVGIELKPSLPFNDVTKDIILRAFWDNEPVAAINCPVTDFFGYAFGEPSMQSLLAGVKGNLHYNYFPMPFEKNAKLELEFIKSHLNQTSEIPVEVTVYYTERPKSENEGKFYAEWKREINPAAGSPYQILKKEGRGHYVGTMLQAQGLNPGMTIFFEGDDECWIDGELRLHGTGSEDYFNGGWYALPDRWDQAFSLPTHGCLEYSIPLARTGGYRLLLTDKIPFEKSISLSIEHGPEKNLVPVDYTSVAFYYCDRPPYVNPLPEPSLLEKINPPGLFEYWIQLLPVKALSEEATLSNTGIKVQENNRNFNIFKLLAPNNGYAKFELEVPAGGEYKLYLSYLKNPDGGSVGISQRQIPINNVDGFASEITFVEKEFIGSVFIKKGTNTITVTLNENPQKKGTSTFYLHRIYLEKVK